MRSTQASHWAVEDWVSMVDWMPGAHGEELAKSVGIDHWPVTSDYVFYALRRGECLPEQIFKLFDDSAWVDVEGKSDMRWLAAYCGGEHAATAPRNADICRLSGYQWTLRVAFRRGHLSP